MFFSIKNHFIRSFIFLFIILTACQLQEPTKNHGIVFLENRSYQLTVNKSNKNDVIEILGEPHVKSITQEDTWLYIERTRTKAKMVRLGKNVLLNNNVLVVKFNDYGVLEEKFLFELIFN